MLAVIRNANFPVFIPTIIREKTPRVNPPPQKKQIFMHFFVFFPLCRPSPLPQWVKGQRPLRVQGGARKPLPTGNLADRRNRTLTKADRQVCTLTDVRRLCGINRFRTHKSKTQVLRLSGSRDDVPCGCRAEPANHCRKAPANRRTRTYKSKPNGLRSFAKRRQYGTGRNPPTLPKNETGRNEQNASFAPIRVKGHCPLRVQGGARESLPKAPAARRKHPHKASRTACAFYGRQPVPAKGTPES